MSRDVLVKILLRELERVVWTLFRWSANCFDVRVSKTGRSPEQMAEVTFKLEGDGASC